MTQPTAEQLRLARECALKCALQGFSSQETIETLSSAYLNGKLDNTETVAVALLAIQATEARMAAAVEAERERCAALADNHSFALDIDEWMKMTKKEISAYACRSVAAAIRSQSNG